MSDCLSLISTRVDKAVVAQWVNVNQMTHVLHTEPVVIRSVAKGHLDIESFCVPDLNCERVGIVMYHCCDSGAIHSWTDEVICHVHPAGELQQDTCVKLDCWEINPKHEASHNEVCWTDDPCLRLHELRCCMMDWLKSGKKTSWNFRDSSGSSTFMSEKLLKELTAQAEAECDAKNCVNTRCSSYRWDPSICG